MPSDLAGRNLQTSDLHGSQLLSIMHKRTHVLSCWFQQGKRYAFQTLYSSGATGVER